MFKFLQIQIILLVLVILIWTLTLTWNSNMNSKSQYGGFSPYNIENQTSDFLQNFDGLEDISYDRKPNRKDNIRNKIKQYFNNKTTKPLTFQGNQLPLAHEMFESHSAEGTLSTSPHNFVNDIFNPLCCPSEFSTSWGCKC